jgi:hypothetical protein
VRDVSKGMIISAAVLAGTTILLVGKTREYVAESAARCMEETHNLNDCDRPADGGLSLWECAAIFAGLGALICGASYNKGRMAGSTDRVPTKP